MNPLRILVADDHDLIRRGVKDMLLAHPGWDVCAEATTGREAVTKAEQLKPDIAILDIGMPDLNGLEAARRIRSASPNTEILILSILQSDLATNPPILARFEECAHQPSGGCAVIDQKDTLLHNEPIHQGWKSGAISEDYTTQPREGGQYTVLLSKYSTALNKCGKDPISLHLLPA